MNGTAWYSTSILNWAVNQMITLSISVHPPVAFFSQSQTSCMMIARLSFWCHIRKQMISPSTQIIGEKPQTVSGPLWVIVLLSVKLAFMTVSHVVRRVIYPAGLGVTGLQHWRQLRGRGGSKWWLPLSLFLLINLRPTSLERGCSFRYTSQVVLKQRSVGGENEEGEFWLISKPNSTQLSYLISLSVCADISNAWLIFTLAAWMQRGRRGRGEAN